MWGRLPACRVAPAGWKPAPRPKPRRHLPVHLRQPHGTVRRPPGAFVEALGVAVMHSPSSADHEPPSSAPGGAWGLYLRSPLYVRILIALALGVGLGLALGGA